MQALLIILYYIILYYCIIIYKNITTVMNVNIIKTIIFFIIAIYIIIYINKYYIETYNTIQKSTKKNLTAHPEYIYIYVPLLFFIASKAILF